MSGEPQPVPQSPQESIAADLKFIEEGLRRLEEYLSRWAAFRLWEQRHG